jgi:hypothetical protein
MREGLNLVQLSIDPTTVGFFAQDMMAHIISPVFFSCYFLDVKSSMVQISSAESSDSCSPLEL